MKTLALTIIFSSFVFTGCVSSPARLSRTEQALFALELSRQIDRQLKVEKDQVDDIARVYLEAYRSALADDVLNFKSFPEINSFSQVELEGYRAAAYFAMMHFWEKLAYGADFSSMEAEARYKQLMKDAGLVWVNKEGDWKLMKIRGSPKH